MGPRRRVALPGWCLEPDIHAPNPTPADLVAGVDGQPAVVDSVVAGIG